MKLITYIEKNSVRPISTDNATKTDCSSVYMQINFCFCEGASNLDPSKIKLRPIYCFDCS